MPLSSLLRRFRSLGPDERAELAAYRARLEELLPRLRAIRIEWIEQSRDEPSGERLANAASVYRWEVSKLGQQLDEIGVPRSGEHVHRDFQAVFADAARACQLLATGSRFHKSEAVCDGQTLLVEATDGAERLVGELNRLLRD